MNNYKISLVEARRNNLILHNKNNMDLFNLLEILLDENKSLKDKRGRTEGIEALIENFQDLGIPYEKSQNHIMIKFSVSK